LFCVEDFLQLGLVLSRGIKAGTNSMVESLMESYNMGQGRQVSTETISQSEPIISMSMDDEEPIVLDESGTIRQSAGIDMEQAKRLVTGKLLGGAKVRQGSPGAELAEQDIVELILPAVERLVRQIERTFEYHTTTMGNEPVEQIFFSGAICTNKLIVQYMYSQLGIESRMLDPLNPESPSLGKIEVPQSIAERMEYNLVVALALSDNSYTPNLLYTFRDKERARSALAVDKAIYAVTILILAVLFGVYMWQQNTISETRGQKAMLEQQMKAYDPPATKDNLTALAAKVSAMHMQLKKASLRYESLTLMSEISTITPDHVKLLSVDIDLGQYVEPVVAVPEDPKEKARTPPKEASKESGKLMVLSGFIEGQDVDKFESAFVSYLIRLENSQLFSMPEIHKQDIEEFPGRGTVLRFIVHIKVKAG
jgi:HAMP domain-containing protein